jgi:hypothetical protein
MIFEESTHYSWFQFNWLVSNRLRATVAYAIPFVVCPSNPGSKGMAWYKRLFISKRYHEPRERPEEYYFVQAKLSDNYILTSRDPEYSRRLDNLPSPWREWMRDGDFAAGAGSAISELDRDIHFVDPFEIPSHWIQFGSFDWGYRHPFSFGHYATDEDGMFYGIRTVRGRLLQPDLIHERIARKVDVSKLQFIVAGRDLWSTQGKAYGLEANTLWDQFTELGMVCVKANIDRVQGLNALRKRVMWMHTGPRTPEEPQGSRGHPGIVWFKGDPGNETAFTCLEDRTMSEDDPEDVEKVDADEWGEGGDDDYDQIRYAVASIDLKSEVEIGRRAPSAWSEATLHHMYEEGHRVKDELPDNRDVFIDSEFGVNF